MAMTPAEKQSAYRERQKEKKQAALKMAETVPDTFVTPFHEYFGPDCFTSNFGIALALAGIEAPVFDDDSGAAANVSAAVPDYFLDDDILAPADNSLGRAEVMTGCLIDAAKDLAEWISAYKRNEITQRIAEIEQRDLSDPKVKKAALQEATRLNKMLDQLDKQVRITFPQWKVTG